MVDHRPNDPTDPAVSAGMLARLAHRGPDDEDAVQAGPTWLGHRRLSIVDVAGGRQPLSDGRRWMVANGEIYNHEDLRAELGRHRFATSSDNEVILHALDAWGPEGIRRLRGMFAFVVADADGDLVAARDPLGIKPLYWARVDDRVVFASELRAFEPGLRPQVEAFPPGHWWRNGSEPVAFADLGEGGPLFDDEEQARRAVREVLVEAVERRLMADVGVGVLLSGGLDSSIIAAIAAQASAGTGRRVRSFAVGTEGSADLLAARAVAEHLGLEHHERTYTPDEAQRQLDDVVAAMESYEPSLVRSGVPNWFVAELAARHVKVVLTGEGADELFAGYDYLRAYETHEELDAELVRSVKGLHSLNLQRCDRMSMAHGLEARVPFLDLDVIATARRIPPAWQVPGVHGQEKRLLREAFAGWLPDDVLWRAKVQFGDGSGAAEALAAAIRTEVGGHPRAPLADPPALEGVPAARTAEELHYQQVFTAALGGVRAEHVLGRFATA